MDIRTSRSATFIIRSSAGMERYVRHFAQPRLASVDSPTREWLSWARDEAGHWYSWNVSHDALVESSSGEWFTPIAPALLASA